MPLPPNGSPSLAGKKLALNSKDPGLAQFAAFAAKNFNQLDINSANVMARGRQLVFTDPIA